MPGQGVTSMFNFGQSYGIIKGICSAMYLPSLLYSSSKMEKILILLILLKKTRVEQSN